VRELVFGNEVRHAREHGRPEERVGDPRDRGERDDRHRAVQEHERDEDGQANQVGVDDQPLARQAIDQRPESETDHDRWQERDDEEQAHPPRRMGAGGEIRRQGDRGHPRAEA
jgi:hypothetical protein